MIQNDALNDFVALVIFSSNYAAIRITLLCYAGVEKTAKSCFTVSSYKKIRGTFKDYVMECVVTACR
jgi:hypothetical protein